MLYAACSNKNGAGRSIVVMESSAWLAQLPWFFYQLLATGFEVTATPVGDPQGLSR
jgi:hypothetical protein